MSDWEDVPLGDLVEVHNSRRVPLSKLVRAERQGPYPYFGAQGIVDHIDDFIFDGEFLLVAEDGENLRSRKEPIARLVSGQFWVNNHAHILTARAGLADNRFLLHLINHARLGGRVTGAAQPKLTKGNLAELGVPCPGFATQRRVAAVLSAFDELIEINERRIELLEDLARSLYREWFLHFRFPGHEDVELVDSELGPIPEGWEVASLAEVVTTQYGFTASAVKDNVGPKFLRGMDINKRSFVDWSQVPHCEIGDEDLEKFRVDVGDVCVIRMADPGKVGIIEAPVEAVFASYLVRLRSTESRVPPYLLFHCLNSSEYQDWITSSSTGSTRKSASAAVLTEPKIVVPSVDLASRFQALVGDLRQRLVTLVEESGALADTRDLLLPRLVTGRLDISNIELGVLTPTEVE